jgi:hypothetical protein
VRTDERLRAANATELAFLAVTLLLAGVHLYLGLVTPSVPAERTDQFLLIALAFVLGFVAWFSSLWRPVLYLLGAAFVFFLGAIWVLAGVESIAAGLVAGLAAIAFVILAIVLFVRGETRATGP